MQLQIAIAFALLLWWPVGEFAPFAIGTQNGPNYPPLITDPGWVLTFVWGKLVAVALVAQLFSWITLHRLNRLSTGKSKTITRFHRLSSLLRLILLIGLAADLFLTTYPHLLKGQTWLQAIPGLPQLLTLVPYLSGLILIWWIAYPVEQSTRFSFSPVRKWQRSDYVIFNIRHHMLIVALPLAFIVLTYATTNRYRNWLIESLKTPWAPEIILGLVAVGIFVASPVLLRRIWATTPLPDGPLRTKLLKLCNHIGLRVAEILVWHTDGVMVNAAVVGLVPRMRYILLSDTLLETMTDEEIEAVFGHEAGHVRHHHIQFFLLFAVVSMLIVSGIMELLSNMNHLGYPQWQLSPEVIEMIGIGSIIPIWGIFFGWMSRRFEQQADIAGAGCAAPMEGETRCSLPCVVHDEPKQQSADLVCATGTRVFVNALRKVATLNGIPINERSWRHSSIAYRIRFLTSLSGDPKLTLRFLRSIRWIKSGLIVSCLIGLVISAIYIWHHPGYRSEVTKSLIEPIKKLLKQS